MKPHILLFFSLASCLFSGCSQNDYDSDSVTGKDTPCQSMSFSASLPSSTTKVTETADATKGLITAWESTDALQVFHKYIKNSTVGAMQGFTFASKSAGSSVTFAYSGASEYSFTPNSFLYGFNALPTAGNYTQTYNTSSDNFTLSLSGYGSQTGTLSNLRNYDAMYGVSSVNTGGTPSAMPMSHLISVLRFDLTNAAFTGTLTSVAFTYTPSSGSSLLPSSGNFTLSNSGTVTTGSLTGSTSWTVNNIAASSGTAPVYLMTFPDTRSGSLTITAIGSNGNAYYRKITLSGLSLTSGSMKAYTITLNPIATYSFKYYMWDATAAYVNGITNYNTITSGVATNSCKNCPTYTQMQMYIGAGAYWDNTTPWKDASSGTVYTGGVWLKKKAYISGFDAGTATKSTYAAPTAGIPSNTSQYFFLPASGGMSGSAAYSVGSGGSYWSSTPYSDATYAYGLYFSSSYVVANHSDDRLGGSCVWLVQ